MLSHIKWKNVMLCIAGSAILSFGLYNIHALSGVTEGGILGMTLLLNHWLHLSPAVSGFLMNAACYILGWRMLGRSFDSRCFTRFSSSSRRSGRSLRICR